MIPEADPIEVFVQSLPEGYPHGLTRKVIAQHLNVAERRRSKPADVGFFDTDDGVGLCVVAEDRPGLLATIGQALLLNGLDIVSARAYTRSGEASAPEAVDLFWTRHQPGQSGGAPLGRADLAERVRDSLLDLLSCDWSRVGGVAKTWPARATGETRVRFVVDQHGAFSVLEVETTDRAGLLTAIASALSSNGVRIVGSLVNTRGRLVFDRFQLEELDGAPVTLSRRRDLQRAVLSALEHRSVSVQPSL